MNLLLYFIQTIFSQAVFIIGLVCLIGLPIQKKSFDKVISSVIKAMIGFLLINEGGKFLGMALLPLQPMFIKIFNLNVNVPSLDQAMGGLEGVGFEMALIFALGFVLNILIARFTPLKFVHLSAHVSFFYAGLIAALLKFNTSLSTAAIVIIGAIILGIYLTVTCAYVYPFMKNIKGGQGFTLAHSSSVGLLIGALLGKLVGKGSRDIEEIQFPKSLGFLREMTIALSLVMMALFLGLSLLAGPSFVVDQVSKGQDIFSFSLINGLTFGMWITVIITGVRMLLAEIVSAFHGISAKLIPNAIPGLDVPLLFPNHPTSVIVGFLMSLLAGFLGVFVLGLIGYPIPVFPALIPTFFTGAITAIFGNSTGGRRGAIAASFTNGLILIFGQALLLPMVGDYAQIMRVLAETDYAFYGPLLGYLLRLIGI
ncbi:PTS ascorbate transporter subunit IIC [Aerococcus mictus]|uniref:PTS ascorbate transporter subunit IIC n=1 Tax=Aerococcus mictus TaxID=2976810 RepID=UPI0008A1A870|nr:PTS ascorbate transporter subunit IIC [Aerococcus mictus]OFM50720.1 SgaT protein [Aerococcus mictus]